MFENDDDLACQREVMEIVFQRTLHPVPFLGPLITYREHPTKPRQIGHDFDVFLRDQLIGIVEVKCREYDAAFFRREGGFLAARDKLVYLFRKMTEGTPGMFICRTSDGLIFGQMVEYLIEQRARWADAPDKMTGITDHGRRRRNPVRGYIIPVDLFTRLA